MKLVGVSGVHVNDLPVGTPERALAEFLGDTITTWVGHLARDFPNKDVNALMSHVWNLLGSRTVHVALFDVPAMGFAVIGTAAAPQPIVMVPESWLRLSTSESSMAVGALVACGSQAVDFYNDRLMADREASVARALAYEAEFLRTSQQTWPEDERNLNRYQRSVLERFPNGLPDNLRYEMKPTPTPESP